jgi:hypothetical protein
MKDLKSKKCIVCSKVYAVSGFALDRKAIDGRKSVCKSCQSENYRNERQKAQEVCESDVDAFTMQLVYQFIKQYQSEYMKRLFILFDRRMNAAYVGAGKNIGVEIARVKRLCSSKVELVISVPVTGKVITRIRALLKPYKIHDQWYKMNNRLQELIDNIKS